MDGEVEVCLLGPFRLQVGGEPVLITAPRLRDLLAVLALAAGDAVGVTTIGDRVWGENPPARLRPTVQTWISRLRSAIGPDLIRAWPDGYALIVPRGNVDALRFVDELDRSRRQPVPADERRALAAALERWTGEPFAGLSAPWFSEAAAPALIEHWLTARERRIDLDLALGAHDPLLAELRELTAQYPLRESLWTRLIRLLDLTGRHAEALACYDHVRRIISAELGVEPGPELRRLYAELLAVDSPAPAEFPVPRQLPAETVRMTGREDELKELAELVADLHAPDPPTVIVVVCGVGGAGKTTLAVHWAHQLRHLFPAGQLYLNLRGFGPAEVMSTGSALRTLLAGLGVQAERIPGDEPAQSALLRSTLAGRRMLFLFDNVRDASQLRPLLPGRGSLVIVTSRDRMRSLVVREGAHRITLTELPPAESARLVRSIAPTATPTDAAELAALCGHLPLALAIAAEHAARREPGQVAALIRQMRAEKSPLDAFEGSDESTDLRAIFSWSHRALRPEAARLYEVLGLYPGDDFSVLAVAALLGRSATGTRRALSQLADLHLVIERDDGRYELHDLVRGHTAELAAALPAELRDQALDRLCAWYVQSAHAARLIRDDRGSILELDPLPKGVEPVALSTPAEALAWYDAERQSLAALVRLAHSTGRDRATYLLVEACEGDLSGRDLDLHEELLLLALDSSSRLTEPGRADPGEAAGGTVFEGFIHNSLGLRYVDQGDDNERAAEHFRLAIGLFAAAGHETAQSRALGNLAIAYDKLGRPADAIALIEQSLAIKRRLGDEAGEARTLANLGATYLGMGRIEEAAEAAGQAIRYFRDHGIRRGEGPALDTLGVIERERGRYDEALSCHLESLRLHRDLGYPWGEAVVLTNLGKTYHAAGRPAEAAEAWRRALVICDQIQAPRSGDLDRDELTALLDATGQA